MGSVEGSEEGREGEALHAGVGGVVLPPHLLLVLASGALQEGTVVRGAYTTGFKDVNKLHPKQKKRRHLPLLTHLVRIYYVI